MPFARTIIVSTFLFVQVSLAQTSAPTQESPVFKSEANLVPINVQVLDRDTHQPIGGLHREDFTVLDEGNPVDLGVFDSSPAALNLVLLLDVSGGLMNEGILFTTDALLRLRERDDRYALISFSDGKARRRAELTESESEIQDAREVIFSTDRNNSRRAVKTSRLWDAVDEAIQALEGKPAGPRHSAIVVITHNREANSKMKEPALKAALLDSGIMVYAITIPQEVITPYHSISIGVRGRSARSSARGPYVPTFLDDLKSIDEIVKATGGRIVPLNYKNARRASHPNETGREWDSEQISNILDDQMMIQLRTQYMLGIYNPSMKERRYHRLHVQLSEAAQRKYPNAVVHARAGYYSGMPEAPPK